MERAPYRRASSRRKHNGGRRYLFVVVGLLVAGFADRSASAGASDPGTTPLVGRVVDERRFPVPGARVTLRMPHSSEVAVATTDADGRFEVPLQPPPLSKDPDRDLGSLLVTTGDRRVACSVLRFRETRRAQSRIFELYDSLVVAPGGRLRATVRDGAGPVPDAVVELRDEAGGSGFTSTRTDALGVALVDPAPVGEFVVFAKKAGRGRASVGTKIERGSASESIIELRPLRTISVEVVDVADGSPVADASMVVLRDADGPNPGPFAYRFRHEDFVAEPPVTDEHGRLELRDLEAESRIEIRVFAPHHVMSWGMGIPPPGRKSEPQHVSADGGSARFELLRRPTRQFRYVVESGSIPLPPDGTSFRFEPPPERMHSHEGPIVSTGTYHEGLLDFSAEVPPNSGRPVPITGWMTGPASVAIQLVAEPTRGLARLVRCAPLDVAVVGADGSPLADREVTATFEAHRLEDELRPRVLWTDAAGTVRFDSMRVGRWNIVGGGVAKIVDLEDPARIELRGGSSAAAEILLQFTVDGERRLPSNLSFDVEDERRDLRREDPARGDVHVFVGLDRPAYRRRFRSGMRGFLMNCPLPELSAEGPAILAVPISTRSLVDVVGHVHGFVRESGDWQPRVALERLDEKSGKFVVDESRMEMPFTGTGDVHFGAVEPGTYCLAFRESGTVGKPVRIGETGATEPLELDASTARMVRVIWNVPESEAGEFLELGEDELMRHPADWETWQKPWPSFRPERNSKQTSRLCFDLRAPPALVIHHPYLVGSNWNDVIDLTKPRSAITLHVEAGPLVTMTPVFPDGVAPSFGAFVTFVDANAPPTGASSAGVPLRALRRGEKFVMAPPAAGARHVVVDPVVAAPFDLGSVAFDGGPRDLGEIRFARGSSLRIHARATAPFAPPIVLATATRLDSIACERRSSVVAQKEAPFDPELVGLGAGRYRVTLLCNSLQGRPTWTADVEVDGVHDAELTILTD